MPPFLMALVLRYTAVMLLCDALVWGFMLSLEASTLLDNVWLAINVAVIFASGAYAGGYFAKRSDRLPSWGESGRLSVVLTVVYAIYSYLAVLVVTLVTMTTSSAMGSAMGIVIEETGLDPSGVFVFSLLNVILLPLVVHVFALRSGAKSMLRVLTKPLKKAD